MKHGRISAAITAATVTRRGLPQYIGTCGVRIASGFLRTCSCSERGADFDDG